MRLNRQWTLDCGRVYVQRFCVWVHFEDEAGLTKSVKWIRKWLKSVLLRVPCNKTRKELRSKLIQTRGTSALLGETAGKAFGTLETGDMYRGEDKVTSAWLPLISFAERIIQLHQLRKIIRILEMGSYYLTAGSYPSIKLSWRPSDSCRGRSTCSEHCGPLEVCLSWWTVWEAWKYWLQFCRVSLNSRISSVLITTKKNPKQ